MIRPATPKAVGLVLALITFATACAERGLPTASGPQSRVTANQVSDGPDIEPSAELLAFGEVALGERATLDLEIQNVGSEDLVIDALIAPLGDFTHVLSTNDLIHVTVLPGDVATLTIQLRANREGPVAALLVIESNDPVDPRLVVELSGFGVPVGRPPLISRCVGAADDRGDPREQRADRHGRRRRDLRVGRRRQN